MIMTIQPRSLSLSRVKRVWSYHSLTALRRDSESASSGLSGSSMMIMSAPRPVSTPPTDVAMRVPCSVVAKSYRLAIGQPYWKEPPIPRACHDTPAVAGEFIGEVLTVTRTDDVGSRVVREIPSGEGDRGAMGFELPRSTS